MATFDTIQRLLPTGEAWRVTIDKPLRGLFEGLATIGDAARSFVEGVYFELFPGTTSNLQAWEQFYGIPRSPNATEDQRRQALAAEWTATGGQTKAYFEGVLQAAGFDVWIHEWWEGANVAPRTPRDPRDYVANAVGGTVQCGEPIAQCGEPLAQCNNFLVGTSRGYWDNLNLTPIAPPPIPADPAYWPFFLYFGGQTFPLAATVPEDRVGELQRLIQKLKPTQQWVVLLATSDEEFLTTESGSELLTEDGVEIVI